MGLNERITKESGFVRDTNARRFILKVGDMRHVFLLHSRGRGTGVQVHPRGWNTKHIFSIFWLKMTVARIFALNRTWLEDAISRRNKSIFSGMGYHVPPIAIGAGMCQKVCGPWRAR